jgi:hypothetical protein
LALKSVAGASTAASAAAGSPITAPKPATEIASGAGALVSASHAARSRSFSMSVSDE